MALRRGQVYLTVVVPAKLKEWVTRKARRESRTTDSTVSRSRVVTRILAQAQRADEGPSRAA